MTDLNEIAENISKDTTEVYDKILVVMCVQKELKKADEDKKELYQFMVEDLTKCQSLYDKVVAFILHTDKEVYPAYFGNCSEATIESLEFPADTVLVQDSLISTNFVESLPKGKTYHVTGVGAMVLFACERLFDAGVTFKVNGQFLWPGSDAEESLIKEIFGPDRWLDSQE